MKTREHKDQDIIDSVIKNCEICFVGLVTHRGPYVIPMNFGYRDGKLFLHSAPDGTAVETLEADPRVSICFCKGGKLVYQHKEVACSYSMHSTSVVVKGKVSFIEDMDSKREALDIIMENYTNMSFTYSDPAVRNVKVWQIEIEEITCKEFGIPNSQYRQKYL